MEHAVLTRFLQLFLTMIQQNSSLGSGDRIAGTDGIILITFGNSGADQSGNTVPRPIRNQLIIGKCGFGQEVFDLFDTAAEIVSLHFHRLRLLEEQPEGDSVQEFLEAVSANADLYLGCGNIRNALNGNNEVSLTFRIAKEALFASESHSSSLLPFTSTLKSSVLE